MGAVGSKIFEQLITLGGRNIVIHDADIVEGHNLHNQLYIAEDVGKPKTTAALDWFSRKYDVDPETTLVKESNAWVTKDTPLEGIVLLAVDTFDGRRIISQAAHDQRKCPLVIEGRCAPTFTEVRSFNPFMAIDLEKFLGSLGSDEDADPYLSICGLPISFSPVMTQCAIMMSMILVSFLKYNTLLPQHKCMRFLSDPMLTLGVNEL